MTMLLIDIAIALLFFLSAVTVLPLIFRKRGGFWIIPLLISLLFLYKSIVPIYSESDILLSKDILTIDGLFFPLIALLWFLMILTFKRAFRTRIKETRELIEKEKALNEARYVENVQIAHSKRQQKRLAKIAEAQKGELYPFEWILLFDEA
ncbi:MAG: hypothetical protein WDA17_04945 [Sphaerochaetaceae bacterium]